MTLYLTKLLNPLHYYYLIDSIYLYFNCIYNEIKIYTVILIPLITFNIIMLDEFAFVPEHIAEDFFRSVYPTISSGHTTKVLIVSTPNGMNQFHKMWVFYSSAL